MFHRVIMRAVILSPIRGWRAAMLLVAAACLSPQRASAECGDHVTILNSSSDANHHVTSPAADPSQPTKPPSPCQGPNCSGAPVRDQTPPAPAGPVGPQVKELAETLQPAGGPDHARSAFDRDSSVPRPIRRSFSVFHPPRLG